ncbi:MAG: hypothetical protein B6D56_01535 [Candidatus Omnitrophica bacterium 4484_70.1]|nr:MAG: hypothetical protein B6D56_01535 [Candidatus Omnitrophica bacterium 4484_70.1]
MFSRKKVTYQQFHTTLQKLAAAFYNLGIRKGDEVAIWFPNCLEFIYSFLLF